MPRSVGLLTVHAYSKDPPIWLDLDGSERSIKVLLMAQNWMFGTSRIWSHLAAAVSRNGCSR